MPAEQSNDRAQGPRVKAVSQKPGSRSSALGSEILTALAAVQGDYQGARTLFRAAEQRFAQRESSIVSLRQRVTGRLSTAKPNSVRRLADPVGPTEVLLSARLLGGCEVALNGELVVDWQSAKAKALFKYLVTHRRQRVPREQLMEALWPDADPQAAGNSLRVTVHTLRQVLTKVAATTNAQILLFEENTYAFGASVHIWLDTDEFEARWTEGRTREKEGALSEANAAFGEAEAVYRGDFLADEPYEEWTLLRRESLKDIQLTIIAKLAQASLQENDYHRCAERCQRLLESDPCREDAYRWLMICHASLGQPGRVQRWFDICKQIMSQQLDLEPSPDTLKLHAELLARKLPQ